jgi:hypothetical protein
MGNFARLAKAGAVTFTALASLLAHLMKSLLFGVAVIVVAVVTIATLVPAIRGIRSSPLAALCEG